MADLNTLIQDSPQWIALGALFIAAFGVVRSNGKAQGRTDALIVGLQERDAKLSGAMSSETAVLAKLVSDTNENKRDISVIRSDVAEISGVLRDVRDEIIEARGARK